MRGHSQLLLAIVTGFIWTTCEAGEAFIAGVQPDRRPENAPVISSVERDAAWFQRALTGVSRPYPASLRFLDDQGNWYTPFNHPGMTGPYDIRGWHQPGAQALSE